MLLINAENLVLILLGLIWCVGAVMQDLRRREVDNLWNFSLIFFALAYRAFVSIGVGDYWFLLNGFIGLVIFVILGNLFYYARLFAGGDAKLLIALGVILPLSYDWIINFKIFGLFIVLFLSLGSIWAILYSFYMIYLNWKSFKNAWKKYWKALKALVYLFVIFAVVWTLIVYWISQEFLILIGLVVLLFPILLIFAKSVEKVMIRKVSPKDLTEGEWLNEELKVGGKIIKPCWEGVSARHLKLIKEKYRRKISIKVGIPFTPSFLFALIGLLIMFWKYRSWF